MSALTELVVEAQDWAALDAAADWAERAAQAALAAAGVSPEGREIAVLLTDDASIAALNADHRGKATPTDVLSWPAFKMVAGAQPPQGAAHLGDIALAWGVVTRDAAASNRRLDHHFAHLIAHGVLHLLGYDHIYEDDAEVMEGLERQALAGLGIADPYDQER